MTEMRLCSTPLVFAGREACDEIHPSIFPFMRRCRQRLDNSHIAHAVRNMLCFSTSTLKAHVVFSSYHFLALLDAALRTGHHDDMP